MAGAILSSALTLAISLVSGQPAAAKSLDPEYRLLRGEVQQFGDWLVGCDNQAECVMIGFPKSLDTVDGDHPLTAAIAVRIAFGRDTGAAPGMELIPVGQGESPCGSGAAETCRLRLSIGDPQARQWLTYARRSLAPEDAESLLSALLARLPLAGVDEISGRHAIRFPSDQFVRAYRALQSRQTQLRRQLSDAATSKLLDELPDGSAMAGLIAYRRLAATEVMVSGLAPIFPNEKCGAGLMTDMRHYLLPGGADLWSYACDEDSLARRYWQMGDDPAGLVRPLNLPEPREGSIAAGIDGLENAIFDWDFGILRSYEYATKGEDCGVFRAWGFTQTGWILIERREMPICMGLVVQDWIRTHYQATDGAGPDE